MGYRNRSHDLRLTAARYRRQMRRRRWQKAERCAVAILLVVAVLWLLWAWMRPAEAVTPYSDGEWRTRIVRADQLPSHDLPNFLPDWERHYKPVVVPGVTVANLAWLDVWCEQNAL